MIKKTIFISILFAFLVSLFLSINYIFKINKEVDKILQSPIWDLPMHIYARPLELFEGVKIQIKDLEDELKLLGYSQVTEIKNSGEFKIDENTINIFTRGFSFYEGKQESSKISVTINNNIISKLENSANNLIVRLEPVEISNSTDIEYSDRIIIPLDKVPNIFIQLLLATEDKDFYSHFGISIKGIIRAIINNFKNGWKTNLQGGSTITQQTVKNIFLTNERSLKRKINEAIISILLERKLSKEKILEIYINEVYIAQDGSRSIHGFNLASWHFFSKPLNELTEDQMALLVGMVKGPTIYNPKKNPKSAIERRNTILKTAYNQNIFDAEQFTQLSQKDLNLNVSNIKSKFYPSYVDLVRRQLRENYTQKELDQKGLIIFTSFDPILQQKAEYTLKEHLEKLAQKNKKNENLQASLTLSNPHTGEILSIIGDKNTKFLGLNRAIDSKRQIGSLIKPLIYLSAYMQPDKYNLSTLVEDENISIKGNNSKIWEPKNFDKKEHGIIPLYLALIKSYNLATVRLGLNIGVDKIIENFNNFGIPNNWKPYPSILLGAGELTNLEVSQMYQIFASYGFKNNLRTIRNVTNHNMEPLRRFPINKEQKVNSADIYLLNYNLQKIMSDGTGRSFYNTINKNLKVAGKTGTTNDGKDAWFAGFSNDLLAVIWIGFDDNQISHLTGSTGPLPIFTNLIKKINTSSIPQNWPDDVNMVWVNDKGQAVDKNCEGAVILPFIKNYEPYFEFNCGFNINELF